ncbi:MAG TPA: ABC transporter ATP-binding protein, partial [Candidatus Atribacteria bacterium]|nr:ABC transporter ATP-binding protein [Candidatus Atribacteria bacterium]
MIKKLRLILSRKDKIFLAFLFLFSVIISFIETVGISAIMPFISVSTNFDLIKTNKYYRYVYDLLNFSTPSRFVIYFGIALVIFYIIRAILNIVYIYFLSRFSQNRYHIIAQKLFDRYLSVPYRVFTDKNSSILVKSIVTEASNVTLLVTNFLFLLSETLIVAFIYIMLVFVQWKMTLLLTLFLIFNIFIITRIISVVMKRLGEKRSLYQGEYYKVMNKAFSDFKFVKLTGIGPKLLFSFSEYTRKFAYTNIMSSTLGQSPRVILEMVGFSLLISGVVYVVWKYENAQMVIPIMSMYAVAFYRLLPSINRILSSYNQMIFRVKALDIVYEDLNLPIEKIGYEPISFKEKIVLDNITFAYDTKPILKDLNLTVKKGQKLAIIGKSGVGKTTLLDIIIGLYTPTSGRILIDDKPLTITNVGSWRKKIGYIPQEIYLFDGTVKDNVVFGREFNEEKLIDVLKKANIYDFLLTKDGIYTKVGEAGVKLSGGQKQRIAIARALYGEPELLVLDEATSALDKITEEKILKEIFDIGRDKTLIIVTHRVDT